MTKGYREITVKDRKFLVIFDGAAYHVKQLLEMGAQRDLGAFPSMVEFRKFVRKS